MKISMRNVVTVITVGLAVPALVQASEKRSGLVDGGQPIVGDWNNAPMQSGQAVDSSMSSSLRLVSMRAVDPSAAEKDQQVPVAAEAKGENYRKKQRLSDGMEEIVVTAQKRTERLQDVPISIAVLGGDALDTSSTQGVTEALARVPGIGTVNGQTTSGAFISVRGVTNGDSLVGGSSVVAYYIDSAPYGLVRTPVAPDSNAYDLEQVEVLRGPQGTLYGASALSGVVRILTKRVDLDNFELKGRVSGSTTSGGDPSYRGDIAVNVPLVDGKLAARAVLGYQDVGGWVDRPNKNDADDGQIRNMRFKLGAKPTEDLSLEFSAWLSRADYDAPSYSDNEGRHQSLMVKEPYVTDFDTYSAKIDYDFSRFSVSSITSYLDSASVGTVDLVPGAPPVPLLTQVNSEVFSQEILLNSHEDSSWRWTFGLFYRDGQDTLIQYFADTFLLADGTNGSESYAVFGELGRKFFGDKMGWTLGARHFKDDVFARNNVPGAPAPTRTEKSFHATTPRVVLSWYPSDVVTAYATYSEGFRSGFDQGLGLLSQFPEFATVKPDTLKNYEIGSKASFMEGRLSLESAVYYTDWVKVQHQLVIPSFVNGVATGTSAVVNVGSASGLGAEVTATARPAANIQVGLNLGWNDLTVDSPVTTLQSTGVPVELFRTGDRLNLSPEYTAGAFADYSVPLGSNGYEGRFSVSANYTSKLEKHAVPGGYTATALAYSDAIMLARASFAIRAPSNWVSTIFVDNISNEDGAATPNETNIPEWTARVRPRTVGLQFEYRY